MVGLETADHVRAAFDKLKVGGKVIMEVQETFFSKCYAYLIDKFGKIPSVNDKIVADEFEFTILKKTRTTVISVQVVDLKE